LEKGIADHKNQAVIYIKKEKWGMQRKKTFVVVFALLVIISGTQAQTGSQGLSAPAAGIALITSKALTVPAWSFSLPLKIQTIDLNVPIKKRSIQDLRGLWGRSREWLLLPAPPGITEDYYTRHFGFFCIRELKFEKMTGIPLRFRLGSLEQCNALEGKK
jgi:hypothetical protein